MDTVLTLSINQNIADNAADYATRAQKTLSQVVEEYLASISESRNTADKPLGPITTRLAGIINLNKDVDHKNLLANALMEKYL